MVPEEPTAIAAADEALDEPVDGFRLVPLDFAQLLRDGVPEPEYVDYPYLPRSARVWTFGPAESAKTIYMQARAAKLTREGKRVVVVSQENPLATDLDRVARLRPDFERLVYFHMPGLDLADGSHFVELASACVGADVVFLDTLSALWSGDEQSNADVVKLDREVLAPLVRLTGVTVVMIHHVGHPQAFVKRGGTGAGRGASAMGQKADVVLVFQSTGPREFTIEHAKNRTPGGHKEPRARFRIVDTDDGGLVVEPIGKDVDERVAECMDTAVEIVAGSDGTLGTNALKAALNERGFGGSTVSPALAELRSEAPPRLRQVEGDVTGADGKRRKGKPWMAADRRAQPTETDRDRTETGSHLRQPGPARPGVYKDPGLGLGTAEATGDEDANPGPVSVVTVDEEPETDERAALVRVKEMFGATEREEAE